MRRLLAVAVVLLLSCAAIAQQFEVASIKPAAPDAVGTSIHVPPGGRVNITNMTLKEMIVLAWRVQPHQVSGGPAWMDTLHYDVSAKPENAAKGDEIPAMLQALLKDRFQLVIRRETKELPIYALVLARRDGKLGPRLVETKEGSCAEFDPSRPPGPPPAGKINCGGTSMSPRRLSATGVEVSRMLPMLSRMFRRNVVDKTGLTGKFTITLEWTHDETLGRQAPPDAPLPPISDGTGPSIFTAIQEQLGLKLESQKGPVEILVIERAEKPSEN